MNDLPEKAYVFPNPIMPGNAIVIDETKCTGCQRCVSVCRTNVLLPVGTDGKPEAVYPDECWFCGCCVEHCPVPGAIVMEFPMNQRVGWKRKETEEHFRIGMKRPK